MNLKRPRIKSVFCYCLLFFVFLARPAGAQEKQVVVYAALDQIYSEPILKRFEEKTGISVKVVYDSEAAKTVGLAARLRAERDRPRCDVFWNNEIVRTIELQHEDVLAPYVSPMAADIPTPYKDKNGYWTGFAARVRVIVYQDRLTSPPRTMQDLLDPRWRGQIGMAYPLFGTTSTQGAVLFNRWGEVAARKYFEKLRDNMVKILAGNMTACRAVADGELPVALTDSDDAHLLQSEGKKILFVPLDHDGKGGLLIPNTLGLIKNGPNPAAGKQLVDYLLSPEVEAQLAACPSAQIPLRPQVPMPPRVAELAKGPFIDPQFEQAVNALKTSAPFFKSTFGQP